MEAKESARSESTPPPLLFQSARQGLDYEDDDKEQAAAARRTPTSYPHIQGHRRGVTAMGMSYHDMSWDITQLASSSLMLKRAPENKYDDNAIAVLAAPEEGGESDEDSPLKMVAYVRRNDAARLAKLLDEKEDEMGHVASFPSLYPCGEDAGGDGGGGIISKRKEEDSPTRGPCQHQPPTGGCSSCSTPGLSFLSSSASPADKTVGQGQARGGGPREGMCTKP